MGIVTTQNREKHWDSMKNLLVVSNIFYFSIYWGIIIPTDKLIFFRGVGLNHQPVMEKITSIENCLVDGFISWGLY